MNKQSINQSKTTVSVIFLTFHHQQASTVGAAKTVNFKKYQNLEKSMLKRFRKLRKSSLLARQRGDDFEKQVVKAFEQRGLLCNILNPFDFCQHDQQTKQINFHFKF
jgi:hypothetical protein